jgi:hypothetical protein
MNSRALALLLVIVFAASLTAPYLGPAKAARAQQVTYPGAFAPSLPGFRYVGNMNENAIVMGVIYVPSGTSSSYTTTHRRLARQARRSTTGS